MSEPPIDLEDIVGALRRAVHATRPAGEHAPLRALGAVDVAVKGGLVTVSLGESAGSSETEATLAAAIRDELARCRGVRRLTIMPFPGRGRA